MVLNSIKLIIFLSLISGSKQYTSASENLLDAIRLTLAGNKNSNNVNSDEKLTKVHEKPEINEDIDNSKDKKAKSFS